MSCPCDLCDGRVVDQLGPLLLPLRRDLDVRDEDEEAGGDDDPNRPHREERKLEAADAVQEGSQCWS